MGLHELRWPSWFSHGSKDEILSAAKKDVSPSFYQTQSVAVSYTLIFIFLLGRLQLDAPFSA